MQTSALVQKEAQWHLTDDNGTGLRGTVCGGMNHTDLNPGAWA